MSVSAIRLLAVAAAISFTAAACDEEAPSRQLSDLSEAEAAALCADLQARVLPETASLECGLLAVLFSPDAAVCEAARAECAPPAAGACTLLDARAACDATVDELTACFDAAADRVAELNSRLTCDLVGDEAGLQALTAASASPDDLPACRALRDRCPAMFDDGEVEEDDDEGAPAAGAQPASWSLIVHDTSDPASPGLDLCDLRVDCAVGVARDRGFDLSNLRHGDEAQGWGDQDQHPFTRDFTRAMRLLAGEGDCYAGRFLTMRPGGRLAVSFEGGEACEVWVDGTGEGASYRVEVCVEESCSDFAVVDPAGLAILQVR